MEILNSYLEYRNNKPKYAKWKQQRNERAAKKELYFKNNPISKAEKQKHLQKARAILDAVDIMDEYSQVRAENAEIAVEALQQFAISIISLVASIPFLLFTRSKKGQEAFKKMNETKMLLFVQAPQIITAIAGTLAAAPVISWAVKQEIFASKVGRQEAVNKELKSENQFAILNDEQLKEVQLLSESVEIKEETEKQKPPTALKEAIATLKSLTSDNQEVKDYLEKQNKIFEENKKNFNKPLSDKAVQTAKEEQEMITQIVEDIDTASQDYAEDVELGTNTFVACGAILGAAAGFVIRGIASLLAKAADKRVHKLSGNILKMLDRYKNLKEAGNLNLIPLVTSFIAMIPVSIMSTKLQKQASRVARFKVIEDLQNNPEKLMYVDDEKLNEIKVETPNKKKENIFKFYLRALKENKEYEKYIKENGDKNKQIKLAKNRIILSDKQRNDAKQLQENVFKTFNKIDDKSQTYSENTEALGQIVKEYGTSITSIACIIISMTQLGKLLKNNALNAKSMIKVLAPAFASAIPSVILDIFVTKEQKKSSRVAHMMAIEDLKDYRHFANYNNLNAKEQDLNTNSKDTQKPTIKLNKNPFAKFMASNLTK